MLLLFVVKMKNKTLHIPHNSFTVAEVAEKFGVSTVSVRNWIKTKMLSTDVKGNITVASLQYFEANIIGKQKLNQRANKLYKDSHNHSEISKQIQDKINSSSASNLLGESYEALLSDAYRNEEGIFYTPHYIGQDMMKDIQGDLSDKTFLDPCCGSGNFILEAIARGFKPENVYGWDWDANAVEITKKRILEQTGYASLNIKQGDFLEIVQDLPKFDYIFTNPPWGKKLSKADKQKYSLHFSAGKSTDTASLFFFAALSVLENGGTLGFLLPDSFFNISIFESARKKALQYQIERLVDYKKPFKGVLNKAQAIILKVENTKSNHHVRAEFNQQKISLKQVYFSKNPKSIINFCIEPHEIEVIEHVFQLPYITLENHAKFGLGIVTGDNKNKCKSHPQKDFVVVYKGTDITKDGIKSPTLYIHKNLELYQQTAPIELYLASEKLIYKFISKELCFYCDTEQRLILNSANLLVLDEDFPIKGQELTKLLNSEFMSWLFQKIFATHKILKSDLQSLPIHHEYFQKYGTFTEANYLVYLGIKKQDGTYILK